MILSNEHSSFACCVGLLSQIVILLGFPAISAAYWPDEFVLPEGWAPVEGALAGTILAVLTLAKINDIGTNNPDFGSSNYDK